MSDKPVSAPLKLFSITIDFSLITMIGMGIIYFFKILPIPDYQTLAILIISGIVYWTLQTTLFGATIGRKIWNFALDLKISRIIHFIVSSLTTLLCIFTSYSVTHSTILKHPLWLTSSVWQINPYVPDSKDWNVLPFFYSVGGWPKQFNGKPVIYMLPYEKGPPHRFIGHIIAELESFHTQLILEGPKTPESAVSADKLKECFQNQLSYHCLIQRSSTLGRHISEIQSRSPESWSMNWFSVDNPGISQEHQPQGVYLNAVGDDWVEDRFILITSHKVHQTLILKRSKTSVGDQAYELIQKIIGSLTLFEELDSGRAWINKTLTEVQLPDMNTLSNHPELMSKISEIQNQLISKISVEPSSLDAYFHLAGLSMILYKHPFQMGDGVSQISKTNIKSASQYAMDVDPKSQKAFETQGILFELQKGL